MNKIRNSYGFGAKEFIIVLVLIVIVIAVIMKFFFHSNEGVYLNNFKSIARDFATHATSLRDSDVKYENNTYLIDVIENDYSDKIENPWNKNEYCDFYESKLTTINQVKYITLKCGDYLIYNQKVQDNYKDYTVYKVSDWSSSKISGGNVQTTNFYNVEVDGRVLYDKYLTEREFLYKYSNSFGYTSNVSLIKSEHKLLTQKMYRSLEVVK